MDSALDRPSIRTPGEIAGFIERVRTTMRPAELWLFGSRARNDHRPESDWDVLAVLPDDAPDDLLDPQVAWEIARATRLNVTLLSTRRSDLASIWGLPNTLGYDVARDGVRLLVG